MGKKVTAYDRQRVFDAREVVEYLANVDLSGQRPERT
jgi:hypothetical protein